MFKKGVLLPVLFLLIIGSMTLISCGKKNELANNQYDFTLFPFEAAGSYPKFQSLADTVTRLVLFSALNEEKRAIAMVSVWGFLQKDKIVFPDPLRFSDNVPSQIIEETKKVEAVIYGNREPLPLTFHQFDKETGVYAFLLPDPPSQVISIPRGNPRELKPLHLVVALGDSGYAIGYVVSPLPEDGKEFLINVDQKIEMAGGIVVAFKDGEPHVMGIVSKKTKEGHYRVLTIDNAVR